MAACCDETKRETIGWVRTFRGHASGLLKVLNYWVLGLEAGPYCFSLVGFQTARMGFDPESLGEYNLGFSPLTKGRTVTAGFVLVDFTRV